MAFARPIFMKINIVHEVLVNISCTELYPTDEECTKYRGKIHLLSYIKYGFH